MTTTVEAKALEEKTKAYTQLLSSTYSECERFAVFLKNYRGPENKKVGKYSVKLNEINNLFGATWEKHKTGNGHTKFVHKLTNVMLGYSAHQDPVDPAAVDDVAEKVQDHVNIFFNNFVGCRVASRPGTIHQKETPKPDFEKMAKDLIKKEEEEEKKKKAENSLNEIKSVKKTTKKSLR